MHRISAKPCQTSIALRLCFPNKYLINSGLDQQNWFFSPLMVSKITSKTSLLKLTLFFLNLCCARSNRWHSERWFRESLGWAEEGVLLSETHWSLSWALWEPKTILEIWTPNGLTSQHTPDASYSVLPAYLTVAFSAVCSLQNSRVKFENANKNTFPHFPI